MSSIYLPEKLKAKLLKAARRRGFKIGRGRQSQITEYLAYLIDLDEQLEDFDQPRRTMEKARGLLVIPGRSAPTDDEIDEMLAERRLKN